MARPFFGDRRGAVFALFALILPMILAGVLGVVSLSGFSTARADLQAASGAAANAIVADLNAALLNSATPDAIVTDLDKQARAATIVQSLLGGRNDISNIMTTVETSPTSISVTVKANIQNVTGDLFMLPFFSSSATTTVPWSRADQLQIVMAVDSGSVRTNPLATNMRMIAIRMATILAIDWMSTLPNYPDIGMSIVPFTAQVSADPTLILAETSDAPNNFLDHLKSKFASTATGIESWVLPRAYAAPNATTACFSDPYDPNGPNESAFGGTNRPLPKSCETSLQAIRPLAKISRKFVNNTLVPETTATPEKMQRDLLKSTINAISPAGCRNLSMGVTWSLAQLPSDMNPKIIFLVVNGQNSSSSKGRTAECSTTPASQKASLSQLDDDFVAACKMVRDPQRNRGRQLDLIVLQAIEGSPVALKSCASSTNSVTNYFSAATLPAIATTIENARSRLLQAAQAQMQRAKQKSLK